MKKYISIVLVLVLILLMTGCDSYDYLTEIEEYSSMTVDGTTSIEVGYTYVAEEKTFYEFVIEDKAIINEIMAEIFKIELKEYPDARIDFYHRTITVNQGDKSYSIHLSFATSAEEHGKRYLYKSQGISEIIEKYIEDNLIEY